MALLITKYDLVIENRLVQLMYFFQVPCPCAKYDKISQCKPRYGKCVNGQRYIPVKMLDVAGLVPGIC